MPDYNEPTPDEATDWGVPLNDNFADLGIEVTDVVATWGDLPDPGSTTQSSHGQWPVYRVDQDNVFVLVDDSSQRIIGGLGSADHPLPEQHVESLNAESLAVGGQPSDRHYELINKYSFSDEGIGIDEDLIDYHPIIVECRLAEAGTQAATLVATVSNSTDSVYRYLSRSSSGLTQSTDETSFELLNIFQGGNAQAVFEFNATRNNRPIVGGYGGSRRQEPLLVDGGVEDNAVDLNSIQISDASTPSFRGDVLIWGVQE
jgi:hypothetical protein